MVLSLLQNIVGTKKFLLTILVVLFLSLSVVSPVKSQFDPEPPSKLPPGECKCTIDKDKVDGCKVSVAPSNCLTGTTATCGPIKRGGSCLNVCTCVPNGGPKGAGCVDSGVIKFSILEPITVPNFECMDLSSVIQASLPYIFAAAGSALLIFIIYAGYRMMLSQGDPKALAAARQTLIYGIVGLVLIFIAYWIVVVVGEFFGITPFKDVFVDT